MEVAVRYSVAIFYRNKRVAVHNRRHHPGAYATSKEPEASAHRA